jgi:hypothetical protein
MLNYSVSNVFMRAVGDCSTLHTLRIAGLPDALLLRDVCEGVRRLSGLTQLQLLDSYILDARAAQAVEDECRAAVNVGPLVDTSELRAHMSGRLAQGGNSGEQGVRALVSMVEDLPLLQSLRLVFPLESSEYQKGAAAVPQNCVFTSSCSDLPDGAFCFYDA